MLFRQNFLNGDMTFQSDDGSGGLTTYFYLDGSEGINKFSKPVYVGLDGTGHDVKFFGATSGSYMLWDESEDEFIITGPNSTFKIFENADNDVRFGTWTGDALSLITNGSRRLTVLSDGNVGIGTASPSRKLSVAGALELTTADTTLNTANACIRRGNSGEMFLDATGDVTVTIDTNDNNTDRGFNVRKDTSTELFRIQEDGNVGINDSSPSNILSVSGDSTSQACVAKITRVQASASNDTYTFEVDSSAHTSNMTAGGAFAVDVNAGRAFTINGNGACGIGTSTPQHELDCNGTMRSSHNIVSNASYTAFTIGSDRTNDDYGGVNKDYWKVDLRTPGSGTTGESSAHAYGDLVWSGVDGVDTTFHERMVLRANGNLGLGVSVPDANLTIKKDNTTGPTISLDNSENRTYINNWGSGATSGRASRFEINAATTDFAVAANNIYFQIGNAGDAHEKMRIDSSGVGIGCTPNKALEISAATTSGGGVMRLSGTGNASADDVIGEIEFYNADDTDHTPGVMASIKAIAGPSGGEGHLQFLTDMPSEGADASAVAMHISSSAQVGIGTTTALAYDTTATKLHVKNSGSSGSLSELARFEGSSDADGSGAVVRLGTSNDRGMYFEGGRTGSVPYASIGTTEYDGSKTEGIRIASTGKVAISSTTPSANADLTLGGGSLCMAETTTPTADANFGKVYTKSDNKLYFQDGAGTEHEIAFA